MFPRMYNECWGCPLGIFSYLKEVIGKANLHPCLLYSPPSGLLLRVQVRNTGDSY